MMKETRESSRMIIFNGLLVGVGDGSPKRGKKLGELWTVQNGFLLIENGKIVVVSGGTTEAIRKNYGPFAETSRWVNACGRVVMPGFIDSHTHLVFGGSRAHEYGDKIRGESYAEQHGKGRGIPYTVGETRRATLFELTEKSRKILSLMSRYGTTTVEAKSGYGLNEETERKILIVLKTLIPEFAEKITVIPTFLAHAIPTECRDNREEYINSLLEMMAAFKKLGLMEFCDVFCDKLAFTPAEAEMILWMARRLGLKTKAHIDQTLNNNGHQLLNTGGLCSADHADFTDLDEVSVIGKMPAITLLPGVTYHLMEHGKVEYWQERVRELIGRDFIISLATDFNPGSCPCFSMQTIMELAARLYRMSPEEIINAATVNAAYALRRNREIGSIGEGKKADLIICDTRDYRELINNFGYNKVKTVIKNGKIVAEN